MSPTSYQTAPPRTMKRMLREKELYRATRTKSTTTRRTSRLIVMTTTLHCKCRRKSCKTARCKCRNTAD